MTDCHEEEGPQPASSRLRTHPTAQTPLLLCPPQPRRSRHVQDAPQVERWNPASRSGRVDVRWWSRCGRRAVRTRRRARCLATARGAELLHQDQQEDGGCAQQDEASGPCGGSAEKRPRWTCLRRNTISSGRDGTRRLPTRGVGVGQEATRWDQGHCQPRDTSRRCARWEQHDWG